MATNQPAMPNKTASCLLYKLFVLEDARKKLGEEMQRFAEKANEDVQLFFQNAIERSSPDCTQVLKTLEAKCNIIEMVYDFFQQLKTDPEAHSLIRVKSKDFPVSNPGRRWERDVSSRLEFGSMLHDSPISVGNAAQRVGPGSAIPLTLRPQTSCVKADVCDTSSEHLECKTPTDDGHEMLNSVAKTKSHSDSAAEAENLTMQPNSVKLNQGSDVSLGVQDPGRVFVSQHQKQTSSELRRFLQMNCKNTTVSPFSQGKDDSPSNIPCRFQMNGKPRDWTSKEQSNFKKMPFYSLSSFVPVFKVKQNQSENLVSLSYMVATDSEVWDIGDIPMEENHILFSGGQMKSPEISNMERRMPAFPVRKYEETEVTVSHVVDPANFYIQRVTSELQQASARIELDCGGTFAQMRCIPDIGAKVVGWFPRDKLWCRVQVLRICGKKGEAILSFGSHGLVENIEVEVRRIDYGDTARLPLQSIKELDDLTATIPVQALQVSLANVSPAEGQEWSAEAVSWFKDKVNGRVLYARMFPRGTRVTVELFTEKGKIGVMRRGAPLSVRLAQSGHAKHKMKGVNLKSNVQEPTRRVASKWEKYLISCYSKNTKSA
ncbi:hypothetical protein GN956_G16418 [Arapaima gigas]